MRALGALLAAVALASALGAGCGKVKPSAVADGGAGTGGGGSAGQPADAGLTPCLDRPSDLPRPPAGSLPCDMLPPTFGK